LKAKQKDNSNWTTSFLKPSKQAGVQRLQSLEQSAWGSESQGQWQ
jgi:hypothetical protein